MIVGLPNRSFYSCMRYASFIKNLTPKTFSITSVLEVMHIWRWRA